MEKQNAFLPYGSSLKPLLCHSSITDSELRLILNRRGIFLYDYERQNTIPLMQTMLLTPGEFIYLRDLHREKESREKRTFKEVRIQSPVDLVDVLSDFSFDTENDERFENYKYIDKPELTIQDDEYQYEYKIERYDPYKDWTETKTAHRGRVSLRQHDGRLEIRIATEFSSDETKRINTALVDALTKHLGGKGIIAGDSRIQSLEFSDFTNEERLKFLLRFRGLSSKTLSCESTIDVTFAPDQEDGIEDTDLGWMKNKVRKMIITGERLEEIEYLKQEDNYKYIVLESVEYRYAFSFAGTKGSCTVVLGFPGYLQKKDDSIEFQILVGNMSYDTMPSSTDQKRVARAISEEIYGLRDACIDFACGGPIKKRNLVPSSLPLSMNQVKA